MGIGSPVANPFYAAMRPRDRIRHVLAHHIEGAAHMAEGYTRARGQHRRVHPM